MASLSVTGIASPLLRAAALAVAGFAIAFSVNNYLIHWRGWPGIENLFAHWSGGQPLDGGAAQLGWTQLLLYAAALLIAAAFAIRKRTLTEDAAVLAGFAAYIVRAAFWGVLLVGLADMTISFLRVEGILADVVGQEAAKDLGRSRYRGDYVHYPLIGVALAIALFTRSLGFTWLALLIVT